MINYITQIDFDILYWMQENLRCALLDFLMPIFSLIDEAGVVWIVISVILICFKRTRYCGFAVLLAMGVDTLITEAAVKNIICRVRPCNRVEDVVMIVAKPDSYGFPSNHTASSFAAAVAILINIRKKLWSIPAFVLAGVIAFSRLYLFVHFPTDVIAGAAIGALISVIVCLVMNKCGFKALLQDKNIIEKDSV